MRLPVVDGRGIGDALIRGQEPEEMPQLLESPPVSAADDLAMRAANCGCVVHGIYPTPGDKRVAVSLFEMDSAQPASVFRLRFDFAYDHEKPDRAEFFWARTVDGKGPELPERSVDYQDVNFYLETAMGDGALAAFTEIPIRVLDPSVNDNTAGLSDITVGLKTVLADHDDYQITMILSTFIPSGLDRRGLGTGHTSMEPGVLGRCQLDEQTWLHGELKFWFPIAGDSDFSGEVLRYGIGLSHVWAEWNVDSVKCYRAIIPSIELIGWSVLDGRQTLPDGTTESIDPVGIFNIQPGIRYLCGRNMDFGLSSAFALTSDHWYDQLIRFEFRWFF